MSRLFIAGCYISKMSYIRQGEKSLDGFYSPWHHIEYYRYIRFFSEGENSMCPYQILMFPERLFLFRFFYSRLNNKPSQACI